jgi:heat shock protein HslJ
MTRALRMLLLVLVVSGSLAGPASAQEAGPVLALLGSHWRLARLDGTAVRDKAGIDLMFSAAGRVSGSTGCNDIDGSWTHLGDDRITMGDFEATRARCSGERGRLEDRLIVALIRASTFAIDGDALTIRTAEGAELEFRAHGRTGFELVGDWALAAVDGQPAADIPRSTITFAEGGRLSGLGGCNGYRGDWSVDGRAIRIRHLLAGLVTCADHVGTHEDAFLDTLEGSDTWRVEGDTLTLASTDDKHSLTLRADRPVSYTLTDTDWTIATISDGASATAVSTIRFDGDGTVSGWGGCNSFRGPWTLDGDGIVLHIGPLMRTRTQCDWGGGPDLEASYLSALEDVIGYKTPGGAELWLTTASGVRITFSPPVVPTLVGSTWYLASMGDVPYASTAPVDLIFADDGSFTGNGGCDLVWGSFERRGDALRFVDVSSGERSCERSVDDFQRAFLGVLPFVDRMAFDGSDLLLYAGEVALRFATR